MSAYRIPMAQTLQKFILVRWTRIQSIQEHRHGLLPARVYLLLRYPLCHLSGRARIRSKQLMSLFRAELHPEATSERSIASLALLIAWRSPNRHGVPLRLLIRSRLSESLREHGR